MKHEIETAAAIKVLYRLYGVVRIRAAAVGKFDFEADFLAYKYVVEGSLTELRELTLRRFSELGAAGDRVLESDAFEKAQAAYDRAYGVHVRRLARSYRFGGASEPRGSAAVLDEWCSEAA